MTETKTTKTIEIFRAGTHVAMDGSKHTFSVDDVQAIVDNYDPILFSAPAVIGHPKSEDPAYGWATGLRVRDDGIVEADLDRVDPAFAEVVDAGRYAKVSASFYPKGHPNNPTPGKHYLRHIGFLGASAPGVSGLAPVAFAEGDDEMIEFSIDNGLRPIVWLARIVQRLVRRDRETLIEKVGVEEANKVMPEWEQDAPAEIVAELERAFESNGVRFAEPEPANETVITDPAIAEAELASRQAALDDRERAVAEREAVFAEGARDSRIAEDDVFLDGLIGAGRLAPGLKSQIAAFCEALGESEVIAFAEGEAAQDPRVAFKALLDQHLGTAIRLDEVAGSEGLRFAEGQSVDDFSAAIDAEMASAAAAGSPISAAEASRRAKSRR